MTRRNPLVLLELVAAAAAALSVLAGMAFVLLTTGPIPLEFLTPYIERALSPQGSAVNVKIGATKLTWDGWQRPVDVRAQQVRIFNPAGVELATLDEVSIGLSFPALLTGLVAPSSLDIRRPTVRLTRARDGHFEFGLGDIGGASGQQPALQQLIEGLRSPPDMKSASGHLERISISDAALTLDDQMLGTSWRARDARVELVRGEGAIDAEFQVNFDLVERTAKLNGKLRYSLESSSTQLRLHFVDVVPARIASGSPMLERLAAIDLPVDGTVEALLLASGKVENVRFDLNGGKGRLSLKEIGGSVDVTKARVTGKLEQAMSIGIIDNAFIDMGGPNISAAAVISNITDAAEARVNVVARRFAISDLDRLWPASMRPDLRQWVRDHVRTGRADESTLLVVGRMGEAGFEPDLNSLRMETVFSGVGGDFGGGMVLQDLAGAAKVNPDRVEVEVTNATANWPKSGLPAMTDIRGRAALVPNRRADVWISEAKFGGLGIADAKINVQGLDQASPEVNGDAVIRGPAGRFFQMMQKTEVGGVASIGTDSSVIKGEVTARTLFRFDAGGKFSPDRIQRSAAARITGLAVPAGPMGLAISDGDVTMEYDARDVKVAGQIKVNGAPVAMELRHTLAGPTKDRMHLRVSGTMTDDQRRQLGLGLDKQVSGPIDFDVDVTRVDPTITTANARLKLDRAKVKLQQIYWEKQPGIPGAINLTLTTRKDKPTEISDFSASGGGLKAEGRAWLKLGTSDIQRMELDTLQFGGKDGTNVHADFTRLPGNGWKVELAGEQLNLQPYIDDPDILLDFPLTVRTQLRRLRLDGDRALNDVQMTAEFGGQYWDKLEVDSKLDNRSDLSVRYMPAGDQRDLLVYATDAGAFLQMTTGTPHARDLRGGELAIRATREPASPNSPTEGVIQMRGFSLRDTPTGDKILASAQGFGPFEVVASEDLNFSRLEASFRKVGEHVELKNLMALSRGLGMNAKGAFDLANNQMNVSGYVSPFRGIGQILDENPWVGAFLANVDKQGLIAVPFTGTGAMTEPDFKVDKKPQPLPPGQMREFARLATGKDRDLSAESRMKPAGMTR